MMGICTTNGSITGGHMPKWIKANGSTFDSSTHVILDTVIVGGTLYYLIGQRSLR
jgi:hypothetical protein